MKIYEQDIIAVRKHGEKLKTNTDEIIVIISLCYNCWGQITVYPYLISINGLFGLMGLKNAVISL